MSTIALARPGSRRGFLAGLTRLPLIGGGIALLGTPTRAAEPITANLLDSYDAWLHYERRLLRWERYGPNPPEGDRRPFGPEVVLMNTGTGRTFDFVACDNAGGSFHSYGLDPSDPKASDRAAVVLSAVGCNWREDRQ